jgi:hypothetical protein
MNGTYGILHGKRSSRTLGSVERPQDWLTSAYTFSLTSREEPFSVVMLWAALVGLPIVCFSGTDGAPEVIQTMRVL